MCLTNVSISRRIVNATIVSITDIKRQSASGIIREVEASHHVLREGHQIIVATLARSILRSQRNIHEVQHTTFEVHRIEEGYRQRGVLTTRRNSKK